MRTCGSPQRTCGLDEEREDRALTLECGRRKFLQGLSAAGALEFTRLAPLALAIAGVRPENSGYKPGRIQNEYSLFLPGEQAALASPPLVAEITGQSIALAAVL